MICLGAGHRLWLPDFKPRWLPNFTLVDGAFTIATRLRMVVDTNAFAQDAARLSYQVAAEYRGFATDNDRAWQLTDLSLAMPVGNSTTISVGKIRQPFAYEIENSVPSLPQTERILTPLFVSRSKGARVSHMLSAADGDDLARPCAFTAVEASGAHFEEKQRLQG